MKLILASLLLVACGSAELPPVNVIIQVEPTVTPAPETVPQPSPIAKEITPEIAAPEVKVETEKERIAREACESLDFEGRRIADWFFAMRSCAASYDLPPNPSNEKWKCENFVLKQPIDNFMAIRKELAECVQVPEQHKYIGRIWVPIWEQIPIQQ